MNRNELWEGNLLRQAAKCSWYCANDGEPLGVFVKMRCNRRGRSIRTESSKRHTAAYNYGYTYRVENGTREKNPFGYYSNDEATKKQELELYEMFKHITGHSYKEVKES